MQKLFLLDAFSLIYRAYYAFINNPRRTSKGLETSAIFGFLNTLLEVIKKEKPTHLAVAFDTAEATFRHENFEAYKAHRQQQPEGITIAVPYIKQLLKAMRIPILELPGYEADDIIGTIAKQVAREDFPVYMMTPDKDYCQLVENQKIFIYRPATKFAPAEILDEAKALEKFGVQRVEQIVDVLGLQGDTSDNIPGLPGVGEKTAQKLIAEYGSIENLIANADKLSGKIADIVKNYAQQALLSKELVTIHLQVPISYNVEDFRLKEYDKPALAKLLDELEFKTLKTKLIGLTEEEKQQQKSAKKQHATAQLELFGNTQTEKPIQFFKDETSSNEVKNIRNTLHHYHIIDTPALRKQLIDFLRLQKAFCFDTETTSLDHLQAELVGIAFAYYPHEAYYVPFPAERKAAQSILEEFREIFENENIEKIGQNLKYDISVLQNYGISVKGKLFDTMIAHYLINSESKHSMDFLAEKYLNYQPVSIETLIGKKGVNQGNMRDVGIQEVAEYACEDADITFQLAEKLAPELQKIHNEKLFYEVETPLIQVLCTMERNGVSIDVEALRESSESLEKEIKALEQEIYKQAGREFNIASPKQLGEVLFEELKLIKNPKKTKTGQYATGEEILSKLADEHPIVANILEIRELQKLKSTYIDALPELISPLDGKIHTSFNQAVTATGRLSSSNPNLQNIPIKTAKGREIRKAFVPSSEDYLILSADYSQIELRLMAAFSQDESMLEAFSKGIDIHAATASKIYKVPLEAVTPEMRRNAKTANFAILYGSTGFNLARQLKISVSEATKLVEMYYKEFSAIKKFKDAMIQKAREQEYVTTILGRRRYLPTINENNQVVAGHAERNAVNTPLQGSAADLIKVAMVRIHDFLQKNCLQSKMILQVHDELVFEVHRSEMDFVKENIVKLMQTAISLPVPLVVEVGVGKNWLEAH
ncbi:MAG: DNA polymerase I [Raineya sp.]|nr:DNA polymerase I [Raineya sp.]MDW8296797.1 DNA polymerase I [Raineya sp.]